MLKLYSLALKAQQQAHKLTLNNGEPTLLAHCLLQMSPLNHKRTTSSLAQPIFYVAKKITIKRFKDPHWTKHQQLHGFD
jgi:hypothetical protein